MTNINNNFYTRYLSGNMIGSTISSPILKLKNSTTYEIVCPDCNHKECSIKGRSSKYPDPLISYSINNYGYRSDDIEIDNVKNNFIFSGCSNTFGIGLPYNSIWAYQINKILKGEKFINLGINSGSHKTIVFDIFNYIRKFGKPKGVFILFPNMERHINFAENNDGDKQLCVSVFRNPRKVYKDEETMDHMQKCLDVNPEDVNLFDFYNTVIGLEDYLESINVPLIWGTWDGQLNERLQKITAFKNYVDINNLEIFSKIESMKKPEEFNNPYWDKARDLAHLGTKTHIYFAEILLEAWRGRYEKNN